MSILVGIDIGTSTTRAIAYDPLVGRIIGTATRPTPVTHPRPDYSEHDPDALWKALVTCLRTLLTQVDRQRVRGLAISSFGEAGLPLDEIGRPLYPIMAWYDRRCEAQVASWEQHFSPESVHTITGQPFSTALGVNKWLWLRDHFPTIARQTARWLSVPDYLLWRLTGVFATDYTIAARTGLFDQHSLNWSETLLAFAGLKHAQLPMVSPAGTQVGTITEKAASETGLPAGVPCVLGGHDHLCAAMSVGGERPGVAIDSAGTAEAVLLILPRFQSSAEIVASGYACTAHLVPGLYALRGNLKAGGGSIAWLVRQLSGLLETPSTYSELEIAAEAGVGRRVGPFWLPHLSGSGTPLHDRHSQAALLGVRLEHDRGDLLRALLEALACWLRHNLTTMATHTGQPIEHILLLGGTTRLRQLARLKAAVLNMPVTIPAIPEPSALGAALLAGVDCGLFPSIAAAVDTVRYDQDVLAPDPQLVSWYATLYNEIYLSLYATLQPLHQHLTQLSATMGEHQ